MINRILIRRSVHLLLVFMLTAVFCLAVNPLQSSAYTGKSSFKSSKPVVTVTNYKDANRIKWSKVSGASYYKVYRAASLKGTYKMIRKTKTCYFDDRTSESGKVYYYKVRAFRSALTRSKYSAARKIRTVTRVYIACGHGTDAVGKWDTGCTYEDMTEADLMLPITQDFVRYTRASGIYVYTDADNGNKMNIIKGVAFANKKKLSAYVSVHCDWYKAPTGTYPLYFSSQGRKLAESLDRGVRSNVDIGTRGLCRRKDLRELNATKTVACIFETGSIKYDNEIFTEQHDEYGRGLAMGLCSYLGINFAG